MVVRRACFDKRQWASTTIDAYSGCSLDSWFNGAYKGYFSTAVQALMGSTMFYYTVGNGNYRVATLSRAVFAPSATELGCTGSVNTEGTILPNASAIRPPYLGAELIAQWTRSPITTGINRVAVVVSDTSATPNNSIVDQGSRPCFTLPSTATVTEELELVEG